MTITELIAEFTQVLELQGDIEVFISVSCQGLHRTTEVGVDVNDNCCILYGE